MSLNRILIGEGANHVSLLPFHLVDIPHPPPNSSPNSAYDLAKLALIPVKSLPLFVQDCPVALRYLSLLSQLDRSRFSERRDQRFAPLGCRSE